MSKEYWKTKDGKVIDIDDMDINHLRNVLKMIIRNNRKPKETFVLNGDIAQEFNDSYIEDDYDPSFDECWYYEFWKD